MASGDANGRVARVLVAEHEPHSAGFLEFVLTEAGYQPAIAGNGEEALAAAEQFSPDAILLDPRLPGVSALEVLKRLRSRPSHRGLIVLIIGQEGAPDVQDEALKAAADAYCARPLAPSCGVPCLRLAIAPISVIRSAPM